MKIARSVVYYTLERRKKYGLMTNSKRSGRPRKTSAAQDRFIKLASLRNRRLTAPQIASELQSTSGVNISSRTVARRLIESGLRDHMAVKKPLLRRANKVKRLRWARDHKNWTVERWKLVLWSDESKFDMFGSKRRFFVRRCSSEKYHPDCVQPTVKHGGGNVMVWGCFAGDKTGDLVKIEGIMKILRS